MIAGIAGAQQTHTSTMHASEAAVAEDGELNDPAALELLAMR